MTGVGFICSMGLVPHVSLNENAPALAGTNPRLDRLGKHEAIPDPRPKPKTGFIVGARSNGYAIR